MKLFKKKLLFLLPLAFCVVIFWPFFLTGKIPIPADTILGMYHPFRDETWDGLTQVPYKNPLITDPVRQQYIWKTLVIDQYKNFTWPLWNPYTHAGMPLAANFQSGAFYILNALFFIFSFNTAWGVYIFLGHGLAAVFMFFYLRHLGLAGIASFLGSIVFAFSGFATAWSQWGNITHTLLWLPLILLAIDKLGQGRKWGLVLIFSLVFSFFAGHLQTFFYLFVLSTIYAIFRRKFLSVFYHFLFFALLTAIQWLPTAELLANSARDTDIANVLSRDDWFLPPQNLVQFVVPDFFGNPATGNYWGIWNWGEFVGYVGIIPFFFVLAAILFYFGTKVSLASLVKFFSLAVLVILSFALPTFWARWPFIFKIPLFSSAQPSRLLSLAIFCLAVLSSIGFNKFLEGTKRKKILLLLVPLALVFLGLWVLAFASGLDVSRRNLILPSALLLFLGLMVISRRKILIGLLVLACLADFYRFYTKFNPFVSANWIFPPTKTTEFLKMQEGPYRIASLDRRILPANFATFYGLQTISGYDPLYLTDYARLISLAESGKAQVISFGRIVEPTNWQSPVFDILGVKYLLSLNDLVSPRLELVARQNQTRIYENLSAHQRISLSQEGQVNKLLYLSNKISFEVDSAAEQQLLLADMYYPGWQAKIDGRKEEVVKSQEGLRVLNIPTGNHEIIFEYNPKSFLLGRILCFIGLVGTSVFIFKKNDS